MELRPVLCWVVDEVVFFIAQSFPAAHRVTAADRGHHVPATKGGMSGQPAGTHWLSVEAASGGESLDRVRSRESRSVCLVHCLSRLGSFPCPWSFGFVSLVVLVS